MAATTATQIAALQATANTRRCHNSFFRQEQLKALHDVLRTRSSDVVTAIRKDTDVTSTEATTQCALALSIIKEHYEAINPGKELEDQHRITEGKNARDRREPWGVVYIEPDLKHTPFFSIMIVIGAAVAAGNCIALKLENNLRALPLLLRDLLPQALSSDVFAILSSTPTPESLTGCMQVLQETCIDLPTHTQLASPNRHVIAIIDRTANLARAAQDLVAARFAFGATSPYAPDIVLVNEFVKKEFTELVLQQSIRFLTTSSASIHEKKNTKRLEEATDKNWKMKVITQGTSGSVVELIGQSDIRNPLPAKQTSPVFAITAFTSLDHAIDLVSASAARPVLAAYHFAAPAHASYLSQFIAAETTFVNHVPNQISLGPAAPAFQPFELKKRYTIEHFSRVLPAFVSTSNDRLEFEGEKGVTKLLKNASQEIQEKKRPEWIAHGFFEQGIFIGLGVYGIPLLTCLGTGLFYGVRTGVRYVSLLK